MGTLSSAGQAALNFCEKVIFRSEYDGSVKTALKWGQSLDEFLKHSDIAVAWQVIEDTAPVPVTETAGPCADRDDAEQVSFLTTVSGITNAAEVIAKDVEDKVIGKAVVEAESLSKTLVSVMDASMESMDDMITGMRNSPVMSVRAPAGRTVLFVYDIESAGEHKTDPRRSLVPLRKDHLERMVRSAIATRDPDWQAPSNPKDMILPALASGDVTGPHLSQAALATCLHSMSFIHCYFAVLQVSVL